MKSTKKNSFSLGAWKLALALGTALLLSENSARVMSNEFLGSGFQVSNTKMFAQEQTETTEMNFTKNSVYSLLCYSICQISDFDARLRSGSGGEG